MVSNDCSEPTPFSIRVGIARIAGNAATKLGGNRMSFVEFLKIMWSMWIVRIVVISIIGYAVYEWSSERKGK